MFRGSELCQVRTNGKYRCVSSLGVKFWNGINDNLKMRRSFVEVFFFFVNIDGQNIS